MRAVIQRVTQAKLEVDGELVSEIKEGLLVLLGIESEDVEKDADWLALKISKMRIFDDDNGIMNLSVSDLKFEILIVSQFTLHASTKKGNRPSYIRAARPEQAKSLYFYFLNKMKEETKCRVEQGVFGANMRINSTNNGPVTIMLDSKKHE